MDGASAKVKVTHATADEITLELHGQREKSEKTSVTINKKRINVKKVISCLLKHWGWTIFVVIIIIGVTAFVLGLLAMDYHGDVDGIGHGHG